jgi:hypothetical protein
VFFPLALVAAQGCKSAMAPVSAFTIAPIIKRAEGHAHCAAAEAPEPGSQKPAFTNDSVGSNKAL